MKKELRSRLVVHMTDCDPFRHLKNSKYLDYIMNVRMQQIKEHYDLDFVKHAHDYGKSWVVMSNQIKYMRPALMGEEVVVTTRLINHTESVLHLEAYITDIGGQELKCVLWSRFKYVNFITGRPETHPEDLMKLFSSVTIKLGEISFDDRCRQIYNEGKVAEPSMS